MGTATPATSSPSACRTRRCARAASASSRRLLNSGFGYPNKAVTINLAPANVRKEGAGFDLPMAVGILGAMGQAPKTNGHLLVGELSLDGSHPAGARRAFHRRLRARRTIWRA